MVEHFVRKQTLETHRCLVETLALTILEDEATRMVDKSAGSLVELLNGKAVSGTASATSKNPVGPGKAIYLCQIAGM